MQGNVTKTPVTPHRTFAARMQDGKPVPVVDDKGRVEQAQSGLSKVASLLYNTSEYFIPSTASLGVRPAFMSVYVVSCMNLLSEILLTAGVAEKDLPKPTQPLYLALESFFLMQAAAFSMSSIGALNGAGGAIMNMMRNAINFLHKEGYVFASRLCGTDAEVPGDFLRVVSNANVRRMFDHLLTISFVLVGILKPTLDPIVYEGDNPAKSGGVVPPTNVEGSLRGVIPLSPLSASNLSSPIGTFLPFVVAYTWAAVRDGGIQFGPAAKVKLEDGQFVDFLRASVISRQEVGENSSVKKINASAMERLSVPLTIALTNFAAKLLKLWGHPEAARLVQAGGGGVSLGILLNRWGEYRRICEFSDEDFETEINAVQSALQEMDAQRKAATLGGGVVDDEVSEDRPLLPASTTTAVSVGTDTKHSPPADSRSADLEVGIHGDKPGAGGVQQRGDRPVQVSKLYLQWLQHELDDRKARREGGFLQPTLGDQVLAVVMEVGSGINSGMFFLAARKLMNGDSDFAITRKDGGDMADNLAVVLMSASFGAVLGIASLKWSRPLVGNAGYPASAPQSIIEKSQADGKQPLKVNRYLVDSVAMFASISGSALVASVFAPVVAVPMMASLTLGVVAGKNRMLAKTPYSPVWPEIRKTLGALYDMMSIMGRQGPPVKSMTGEEVNAHFQETMRQPDQEKSGGMLDRKADDPSPRDIELTSTFASSSSSSFAASTTTIHMTSNKGSTPSRGKENELNGDLPDSMTAGDEALFAHRNGRNSTPQKPGQV